MYVSSGSACTEKNSQTPMSPAAVTRQAWRVARVGNRFVRGNVALNTLVQQLGGVGIGDDVPGVTELAMAADFRNAPGCDTGILGDGSLYGGRIANPSQAPGFDEGGMMLPVSLGGNVVGGAPIPGSPAVFSLPSDAGSSPAAIAAAAGPNWNPFMSQGAASIPGAAVVPASAASSAPGAGVYPGGPGGLSWRWNAGGSRLAGGPGSGNGAGCVPVQVLPMQTVFPIPIPGAPVPAPVATPKSPTAPAATPAAPVVATSSAPPTPPTTGNVCLDLQLGYVLAKQVSQAQQATCRNQNYGAAGFRNGPLMTNAYQVWRNANYNTLPMIPDQPNVPAYSSAMGVQYGISGFGQAPADGSMVGLAVLAALGFGLWWAYDKSKGAR